MLVDDWPWRYGRRGRRSWAEDAKPAAGQMACRGGCDARRPLLPNQFGGRYVAGIETIFFTEQRDDPRDTLDIVAIAGERQQQAFVSAIACPRPPAAPVRRTVPLFVLDIMISPT
jgi:hypothetical protein